MVRCMISSLLLEGARGCHSVSIETTSIVAAVFKKLS